MFQTRVTLENAKKLCNQAPPRFNGLIVDIGDLNLTLVKGKWNPNHESAARRKTQKDADTDNDTDEDDKDHKDTKDNQDTFDRQDLKDAIGPFEYSNQDALKHIMQEQAKLNQQEKQQLQQPQPKQIEDDDDDDADVDEASPTSQQKEQQNEQSLASSGDSCKPRKRRKHNHHSPSKEEIPSVPILQQQIQQLQHILEPQPQPKIKVSPQQILKLQHMQDNPQTDLMKLKYMQQVIEFPQFILPPQIPHVFQSEQQKQNTILCETEYHFKQAQTLHAKLVKQMNPKLRYQATQKQLLLTKQILDMQLFLKQQQQQTQNPQSQSHA